MTIPAANNTAAPRYLDLLRHALCRDHFPDARYDMSSGSLQLMPFDPALRAEGRDWLLEAVTMVGTFGKFANLLLHSFGRGDSRSAKHSIHSPITTIDWSGIFWRK